MVCLSKGKSRLLKSWKVVLLALDELALLEQKIISEKADGKNELTVVF